MVGDSSSSKSLTWELAASTGHMALLPVHASRGHPPRHATPPISTSRARGVGVTDQRMDVISTLLRAALARVKGHTVKGYDRIETHDEVGDLVFKFCRATAVDAAAPLDLLVHLFAAGTTTAIAVPRPFPCLRLVAHITDVEHAWRLFHPSPGEKTAHHLRIGMLVTTSRWSMFGTEECTATSRVLLVAAVDKHEDGGYTLTIIKPGGTSPRGGSPDCVELAHADVCAACSCVEFLCIVVTRDKAGMTTKNAHQRLDDSCSPSQFSNAMM